MNFEQETDRLVLRVLTSEDAKKSLDFYKKNARDFEKYEPILGDNFYSLSYQKNLLNYEYQEILKLHMLRFWIFEKEHPEKIIGTVSYHNITPNIYSSARLGYKIDRDFRRKGYAYEAISNTMKFVSKDIGIRRYEALVLPENEASIGLLTKLGFAREGLLKDKVYLNDQWRDHFLYAYIDTNL